MTGRGRSGIDEGWLVPGPTYHEKISVPTARDATVERPRLTHLLDLASVVPVTVVHGPAGCGKTEAVAAWARQRRPVPLWASLDTADRDPQRLARTLGAAAGHGETPAEDPEEALISLVSALGAAGREVALVLDGVDELADSAANDLLVAMLQYLPETLHVVVVARGRVPLSMGRLRLVGRLAEIDRRDLALRPEETATLVRAVTGRDEPELADAVGRLADGHAAFAAAAARAICGRGLDDRGWRGAAVDPVLDDLPPDLRLLVTDLAPLPAVTAGIADAVTGRRAAGALLPELVRGSAAVVADGDGAARYRIHPLVRDVLLERLEATDPGRVTATHRTAARWHERHGDARAAIEARLAAGDAAEAWELIARHHVETYLEGGRDVIAGWVARLPATADGDPRQAADRASLMLMVGRPDEAARWVDRARTWATGTARADDLGPLVGYLDAQCHLLWGDLPGALARHRGIDHDRVPVALSELGGAVGAVDVLAQLGRFDEARRALLEVPPLAPYVGHVAQVLVPGVHALLAWCEGHLGEAMDQAEEALAHAQLLPGPGGPGEAWSHLAIGGALLEQGHVALAITAFGAARDEAGWAGLAHIGVRAAGGLARALRLQGRAAEAFDVVEASRRSPHVRPLPPPLPTWLSHAEARLHLLAGDAAEALAVLDEQPDEGSAPGVVLRAWAAVALGERAHAQDLLASELGPDASVGDRIEADLLRVRCLRDPRHVRRHIARAVHRGAVDGYLTTFLEHRDGVIEALHDLRAAEPSPYLTDVLFLLDTGDGSRPAETLTPRELAVVGALQSPRSIEGIAADLDVSVNTLKTHLKAVYRKLDATNRADAVRRALVLHLIGPAAGDDPFKPRAGGP